MHNILHKYGNTALVAGASEGLGAAFASHLAAIGMNLVLVARRREPLEKFAADLKARFKIDVHCISCDLADVQIGLFSLIQEIIYYTKREVLFIRN